MITQDDRLLQDEVDAAVLAGRITPEIRAAQSALAAKRRKQWEAEERAAFADHVYAASEPDEGCCEGCAQRISDLKADLEYAAREYEEDCHES